MTAGHTPLMREVRDGNAAALLQRLVLDGPAARKQLGRATGLSLTTITRLVSGLVDGGVLYELPARPVGGEPGRAGRPETPLGFVPGGRVVVGTHLREASATSSVFDLDGTCTASFTVPCQDPGPEQGVAAAIAATERALASTASGRVLGLGVSTDGVIDPRTGVVVDSPHPGWRNADLRTPFAPLAPRVLVDGSVRCLALDALWRGQVPRTDTFLMVLVANAVASALVVGRSPLSGPDASAGQIAHLPVRNGPGVLCPCGATDCLGVVATDRALHARAVERGLLAPATPWADVLRDDLDTAEGLRALRLERARFLGESVATLNAFCNPEATVIAGSLGTEEEVEVCLSTARARAARVGAGALTRVEHRPVRRSTWDRASAALVLDDFLRRPTSYVAALLD
ncbi:ROK family protein [Streptomyces sp. NPDC007818]|uniref:ROK family protein n=1 Tax=Streptomyces sp. NPDC007818 TaxID=3364780 RepID=UPI0036CB82B7